MTATLKNLVLILFFVAGAMVIGLYVVTEIPVINLSGHENGKKIGLKASLSIVLQDALDRVGIVIVQDTSEAYLPEPGPLADLYALESLGRHVWQDMARIGVHIRTGFSEVIASMDQLARGDYVDTGEVLLTGNWHTERSKGQGVKSVTVAPTLQLGRVLSARASVQSKKPGVVKAATTQTAAVSNPDLYTLQGIVVAYLEKLNQAGLLKGAKGDKGDPGQSGGGAVITPPFVPAVIGINVQSGASSFSATNLGATELTVSGSAVLSYMRTAGVVTNSASGTLSSSIGADGECLTVDGTALAWGACGGGGSSQWTTSGSDIYYNTGNVGIGSTTPGATLDVVGTATNGIVYTNTAGHALMKVNGAAASQSGYYIFKGGTEKVQIAVLNSSNDLTVSMAGTPRMTVQTGGNVGIGTTSAASLLNVGSGTPTTAASGLNFGTDTSANLYRSASATIKTDGTLDVATAIKLNGTSINTGGTLSNVAYLDQGNTFTTGNTIQRDSISTGNLPGLTIQNTTAASLGSQQYSPTIFMSGRGWSTGNSASRSVDFIQQIVPVQGGSNPTGYFAISSQINNSGFTNHFNITSDGFIGIGTTQPLNKFVISNAGASGLEINPSVTSGSSSGAYIFAYDRNASTLKDILVGLSTNFTVFKASGNVGIGTTTVSSLLNIGADTPTTASSGIQFGTDASANLYRSASGTIKTDGAMTVAGALTVGSCTGCSATLSGLGAATATNTINNADYAQTWQWNSLSSNTGLTLTSSSTAAASNTHKVLAVSTSGANSNSNQTTYGAYITNSHGGTGAKNIALYASATGAPTNLAALFENGYVGMGPGATNPTTELVVSNAFSGTTFGNGTTADQGLALINSYNFTDKPYGVQFGGYSGYTHSGIFGIMTDSSGNTVGDIAMAFRSTTGSSAFTETLRFYKNGNITGANLDLGNGTAGPVITIGRNNNGTATGAGSINFQSKGGTAGYVWQDNAGNLRIHTAAPSNANDTAGTVVGAQTSTRETKTDIADFTDYLGALNMVTAAPLHTFKYIKDVEGYGASSPLAKTRIGYIADEVPGEFMWGNSIDQVSVNGILMAALKALDKKHTELEVRVGNANSDAMIVTRHLYLSGDTVGNARILPRAKTVRVTFATPYKYQPIVTISTVGESLFEYDYRYTVTDIDTTGFTIKINRSISTPADFAWHAFASPESKLTVSNGSQYPLALVLGDQVGVTEPEQPAQSSSPAPKSTQEESEEVAPEQTAGAQEEVSTGETEQPTESVSEEPAEPVSEQPTPAEEVPAE